MYKKEQSELEKYVSLNRERWIGFITQKLGDPDLAEDLLQDCLLKALRSAGEVRDKEKWISWFYQILRNAIIDVYRKQKRQKEFRKRYALQLESEITSEEVKTPCECFTGLIPTMNREYATIIEAIELGDEHPAELSHRLDISRNHLKVKRFRARKQLKERLEQTCKTCAKHGCLDCTCNGVLNA